MESSASSGVAYIRLRAEGAHVAAYDPMVPPGDHGLFPGVRVVGDAMSALEGADAAVLVTEWPEFREIDWKVAKSVMRGSCLVDGRNVLDPVVVRAAGLSYEGVGVHCDDRRRKGGQERAT